MSEVVVGIDVGTTKICTIVGEVRADDINILGVGIEPSRGMHKGVVNDVQALTRSVSASVRKAEQSSSYRIGRAYVSVAGAHIASTNSAGISSINPARGVQMNDLERAMEAARAVALPHDRELLHVIPRSYKIDQQDGIRSPLGMLGYRLEVEAHIVMASTVALRNLQNCIQDAGVDVDRFILNPLASGDVVLNASERNQGVVVIDIGGGTTDIALYIEGTVWHTGVIPVGGWHVTNDIAQVLHLPYEIAEQVKLEYGTASPKEVGPTEMLMVQAFGEEQISQVQRRDLAEIIHSRVEELFQLVLKELKCSAYDGLLSAGVVLTGGSAQIPGIKQIATEVLKMPVRVAQPERLSGIADTLRNPSYSTSVGLLRLGLTMDQEDSHRGLLNGASENGGGRSVLAGRSGGSASPVMKFFRGFLRRLLPDESESN